LSCYLTRSSQSRTCPTTLLSSPIRDPLWPEGKHTIAKGTSRTVESPVWKFDEAGMNVLHEDWRSAGRRRYIGLRFSCDDAVLAERYNWNDWWFAEVKVNSRTIPGFISYRVQRNTSAIIDGPDYKWLREQLPGSYATPET
jgi:hypothetical protein